MAAAEQSILEAVHTVLTAGATAAGIAGVHLDRLDPLRDSQLPAWLVEEDADGVSVDAASVHNMEQRELSVTVATVVAHGTDYAENARNLALAAEKLIAAWPKPAAFTALKLKDVRLGGARTVLAGEGDKARAMRLQTWRITYFVEAHAPDVPL